MRECTVCVFVAAAGVLSHTSRILTSRGFYIWLHNDTHWIFLNKNIYWKKQACAFALNVKVTSCFLLFLDVALFRFWKYVSGCVIEACFAHCPERPYVYFFTIKTIDSQVMQPRFHYTTINPLYFITMTFMTMREHDLYHDLYVSSFIISLACVDCALSWERW